jgi:hypothetical protein
MKDCQQKIKLFGSETVFRLICVLCKYISEDAVKVGERKTHPFCVL